MRTTLLLTIIATLCLTGCDAGVTVTQDVNGDFTIAFDLPDTCSGSADMTGSDGSQTSISLTQEQSSCTIDYDWLGQLLDGDAIMTAIQEETGNIGDTVIIDALSGTVNEVKMIDVNGADVAAPSIEEWLALITVEDQPFFNVSAEQVSEFLAGPVDLTVSDAILDAIEGAINTRVQVPGVGNGRLKIPDVDFARVADVEGLAIFISVDGSITATVGNSNINSIF